MSASLIYIDMIGEITNISPIVVSGSSISSFALSAGNKGAFLQNVGTKSCYMGGSDTDGDTTMGLKFFAGQTYPFRPIKAGTSIYFNCATGDTTTIVGFEYAGDI